MSLRQESVWFLSLRFAVSRDKIFAFFTPPDVLFGHLNIVGCGWEY